MLLALGDTVAHRGGDGPYFLFPLLLLLLFGFVMAKLVRRRRGGHYPGGRGSAMQTLQERFARGEIDRAEFDHRKAVLEGSDSIPPAPRQSAPQAPPPPPVVDDTPDSDPAAE